MCRGMLWYTHGGYYIMCMAYISPYTHLLWYAGWRMPASTTPHSWCGIPDGPRDMGWCSYSMSPPNTMWLMVSALQLSVVVCVVASPLLLYTMQGSISTGMISSISLSITTTTTS